MVRGQREVEMYLFSYRNVVGGQMLLDDVFTEAGGMARAVTGQVLATLYEQLAHLAGMMG